MLLLYNSPVISFGEAFQIVVGDVSHYLEFLLEILQILFLLWISFNNFDYDVFIFWPLTPDDVWKFLINGPSFVNFAETTGWDFP